MSLEATTSDSARPMTEDRRLACGSGDLSPARAQAAARVRDARNLASAIRQVLGQDVRPRGATIMLGPDHFGYELSSNGIPLPTLYGRCPRCLAVTPSRGFRNWAEFYELQTRFIPAPHSCNESLPSMQPYIPSHASTQSMGRQHTPTQATETPCNLRESIPLKPRTPYRAIAGVFLIICITTLLVSHNGANTPRAADHAIKTYRDNNVDDTIVPATTPSLLPLVAPSMLVTPVVATQVPSDGAKLSDRPIDTAQNNHENSSASADARTVATPGSEELSSEFATPELEAPSLAETCECT
jgi:hypothetical protein